MGYTAYDGADTENHNLAIGTSALGGSVAGGEYNVAVGNYSLGATTLEITTQVSDIKR